MKLVQGPYSGEMLRHPLFGLDVRSMKPAWQPQQIRYTSRRVVLLVHAAVIGLWALLAVVTLGPRLSSDFYAYAVSSVNLLVAVSILLDVILDFVCLQGAVKTISGEITARRWDLLRLTALTDNGIVRAKHAGARLRVWRMTMVVAGARLTTITLILLGGAVLPVFFLSESPLLNGLIDGLVHDFPGTLLALAVVLITAAVYVAEPFWRAQAMTALGMVLSAYIQSVPLALLAGLGVIFSMWLVQAIIVIALVVGLGIGLGAVFTPLLFDSSSSLAISLYLLTSCLITALTIFGFYALVQTWSLRRVWNRIQKAD